MTGGGSAARRLLTGSASAPLTGEHGILLATAGALAESEAPGTAWEAADTFEDPGLALVVAAGAEAHAPAGRRDKLEELASGVRPEDRVSVFGIAEALLAHIDPGWAWGLIAGLVGREQAVQSALGLDVAARLVLRHDSAWTPSVPLPEVIARQLVADETARAAVAGRFRDRDHPRLGALLEQPPGRSLFPSEAPVLLTAAAAVDPAWALDLASGLLETHNPTRLAEAFRLVADAAVRAGLGSALAAKAQADDFVIVQAVWTAAAASSGALRGQALVGLVAGLAPRVDDELDAGRELLAGLPLLEALAHAGELDLLAELADHWQLPPPLLVDQLLFAQAVLDPTRMLAHEGLVRALDRPESEWATTEPDAVGGRRGRIQTGGWRDALVVAVAQPWRPLPGSLADLVGWPAT